MLGLFSKAPLREDEQASLIGKPT